MAFISEKTVKARKAHICDGCCTEIVPRTTYNEYRGYNDGHYTLRHHIECMKVERELNRVNDLTDDEWMPLHEHYNGAGPDLLTEIDPVVADRLRLWVKQSEERRRAKRAAQAAA